MKFFGFLMVMFTLQTHAQIVDMFDDNRNRWTMAGDENCDRKIQSGKYVLKTYVKNKSRYTWMPAYFDATKDFVLEASFVQRKGSDNNGLGLYWGRNGLIYNCFVITSSGSYQLGDQDDDSWTKSEFINPMKEVNVLRVEKRGATVTGYINDHKIASRDYINYGFEAGFVSFTDMVLEVDYFKFQQENEINLVENMPKGIAKINLGSGVNTKANDLGPIISTDGRTLYFHRKRYEGNMGGAEDVEDIWISKFNGTMWEKAINPGSPINTNQSDNLEAVSADDNTFFFSETKRFFYRTKTTDGWSDALDFGPPRKSEAGTSTAQLSADGKVFLFIAKTPQNVSYQPKVEENDIYVSLQDEKGNWSEPQNLGPVINTAGDEVAPFLAADGRTLYYSTPGKPGFGDEDIFISKRIGDGWTNWTEPQNLGPEINTPSFDAYYTIPASGEFAYVVGYENSMGAADIFSIKLPKQAKPEPVVLIFGKTLNAKTKAPVAAEILLDDLTAQKEVAEAFSNPATGEFRIVLPYGTNYGLHAAAKGFLSVNENMELANIHEYTEVQKDLYLIKIEVGETLQLNNVFFEQGKPVLKSESYPELDRLFTILNDNPKIHIELAGHTDNVGPAAALLKLSQDRVEAVKKYLEGKGIATGRITGKGYGASQPKEKNDTEEHKRANRRVEFKILKN